MTHLPRFLRPRRRGCRKPCCSRPPSAVRRLGVAEPSPNRTPLCGVSSSDRNFYLCRCYHRPEATVLTVRVRAAIMPSRWSRRRFASKRTHQPSLLHCTCCFGRQHLQPSCRLAVPLQNEVSRPAEREKPGRTRDALCASLHLELGRGHSQPPFRVMTGSANITHCICGLHEAFTHPRKHHEGLRQKVPGPLKVSITLPTPNARLCLDERKDHQEANRCVH